MKISESKTTPTDDPKTWVEWTSPNFANVHVAGSVTVDHYAVQRGSARPWRIYEPGSKLFGAPHAWFWGHFGQTPYAYASRAAAQAAVAAGRRSPD